jgi:hypothetical protein
MQTNNRNNECGGASLLRLLVVICVHVTSTNSSSGTSITGARASASASSFRSTCFHRLAVAFPPERLCRVERAESAVPDLKDGGEVARVLLAVLVVHVVPDGGYHEPSDPPWVPVGEWSEGSEGSGERKSEMELEETCSECTITSNPTHPRKLSAKGVKA